MQLLACSLNSSTALCRASSSCGSSIQLRKDCVVRNACRDHGHLHAKLVPVLLDGCIKCLLQAHGTYSLGTVLGNMLQGKGLLLTCVTLVLRPPIFCL